MIFDYPIIMNLKNHLSIRDIHNLSLTCKYYYDILNRIIKEIDLKKLEVLLKTLLFTREGEEYENIDSRLLEYVEIYKKFYIKKELKNLYGYDYDINIQNIPSEIFEIFQNYHNGIDMKKLTLSNIRTLEKFEFNMTRDFFEIYNKYFYKDVPPSIQLNKRKFLISLSQLSQLLKIKNKSRIIPIFKKIKFRSNIEHELACESLDSIINNFGIRNTIFLKFINQLKLKFIEEHYREIFLLSRVLTDYLLIYDLILKKRRLNERIFYRLFMNPYYNLIGKKEIKKIFTKNNMESFIQNKSVY